MAQANDNNPGTSGSAGAGQGSGAGQNRKIAGKFDSVEDAVEALSKGQERMFHETREEMGAIKQLLERSMTPIGSRGQPSEYDDQGYRRGRQNDEDDFDPTEFLTAPQKILKQREARFQQALEARQLQATKAMVNNAAAVLRFQMKNPDLDDHENLVQGFLQETNPNDSLTKRLNDAAKKTRVYLAKLKGKSNNDDEDENVGRSPNNDEFVEGASNDGRGRQQDQSKGEGGANNQPASADDELAAEIDARRKFKSSRFAAPQK